VSHSVGKEVKQSGTIDPLLEVRPVKEPGFLASVQRFGNFPRREEKLICQGFRQDFWAFHEADLKEHRYVLTKHI
jgi:hypothetical protein